MRRLGVGADVSLVVAVSGGADSVSLLDALVRLNRRGKLAVKIFAAHLNHQLRGEESDGDEDFVNELAVKLNVECLIERIAVGKCASAEKRNLEATARRLRYDFLGKAAERFNAQFVCTAHTMDDQAETLLMRLLRGSGAEGLRGIHPVRPLDDKAKLIRPMLSITRAEVLEYCGAYGIEFRDDSSNLSMELTRNRIRHELMPLLNDFNPRSAEALVRASTLLTEDDEFLQQIAEQALAEAIDGARLKIKPMLQQNPAIRRRMLRLWLRNRRKDLHRIESVHIAAIERLIESGQGGKIIEIPGGWRVFRKTGFLEMVKIAEVK